MLRILIYRSIVQAAEVLRIRTINGGTASVDSRLSNRAIFSFRDEASRSSAAEAAAPLVETPRTWAGGGRGLRRLSEPLTAGAGAEPTAGRAVPLCQQPRPGPVPSPPAPARRDGSLPASAGGRWARAPRCQAARHSSSSSSVRRRAPALISPAPARLWARAGGSRR